MTFANTASDIIIALSRQKCGLCRKTLRVQLVTSATTIGTAMRSTQFSIPVNMEVLILDSVFPITTSPS
jgi:hypothetical protein